MSKKRRAMRRLVPLLAVGALTVSLVSAVPPPALAAPVPSQQPTAQSADANLVHLELSTPIRAQDVSRVALPADTHFAGVRYHNDGLIGEQYLSNQHDVAWAREFRADYGAEPRITHVMVWAPDDAAPSAALARGAAQEVAAPAGSITPADAVDRAAPIMQRFAASSERAEAQAEASFGMLAAPTPRWAPSFAEQGAFNVSVSGTTRARTYAYYSWDGGTNNIRRLDPSFGAEFEFNLYNDNAAYSGIRPFCTLNGDPYGGHKSNFWARNYDWSWQGFTNTGNYSAAQPYADINDLSDPCTRQSIALGLRYPRQLAPAANAFADFTFVITAPRGLVASNRLGSVLQSVENVSCLQGDPLTDCMGRSGAVERDEGDTTGAYIMLNPSRGRIAPGTCWSNNDVNPYDGLPDAPYYFNCSNLGG